ncbi:MAG: two-component sensor histidine kinase [Ardenticatenaceae bacterium]|nr:MAG: two-component sensor histidine kinase [Ardenticatenaceae bacterium]
MSDILARVQADGEQNGRFHQRFQLVWSGLFVVATAVAAVLGWLAEDPTPSQHLLGLALCLLLIGTHLALRWLAHGSDDGRAPLLPSLAYIIFSIFTWYILIRISPIYYLVLFGLFSQVYIVLPLRYASAGALTIASLMAYNETIGAGENFSWEFGLIYLLMGAASIVLGAWIQAIVQKSEERRELLDQLQATQAELADAQHRAGILAERQRLAHEIHDTLAQGFISIIMHLETAEQTLPASESTAARQIQQAKETARHNLQAARRVVADLRPESLENHSLPAAIARTVERWSQTHSISATVQTTGTPLPLHPDVDVTLLRATQEALANIHKHAQAQTVTVTLSYMGNQVLLDVQDDGVGLNAAKPSPFGGGFGLEAMRERAAQFGGELLLESEPGGGTTLVVSIPIA